MRSRSLRLLGLPLIAALGLGLGVLSAQPAREEALAEMRVEMARLGERLEELRRREATLEDAVGRVELELELQEMQLEEAATALQAASERVAVVEAEVVRLTAAVEGVGEDLRERMIGLYRLGRHGYLRLFLSLEGDDGLLPAIRQLRFLVRRDELALARFETARADLEQERRRLDREVAEREAWRTREAERRDRLVVLRRERADLLERVARERRRLDREAEELAEKERKLTRLVGSLVQGSRALAGTPVERFRGVLDWPVEGAEVLSRFGSRRDPRYRTEVPQHGIDLGVPSGSVVRAVYDGEVIYADEFEGYGPLVVVHHPGRVFTLYAGLAEIRVKKGDVLTLGSPLGPARERFYFELRRENQPVDPLDWLR